MDNNAQNNTQDTRSIKEYLKEKNSQIVNDVSLKIIQPIESISNKTIDFLKPKNFLSNIGMITKSPILISMDTKLDDISKSLNFQSFELKKKSKNDFLLESQKDKEISLKEENNDLLREIAEKDFVGDAKVEEKKANIFKTVLGKIFGGMGLGGGFAAGGMIGAGLGKLSKLSKIGLKSLGQFGKIGLKGLSKIALPLTLLLGAFDFTKGFRDALNITGRDDMAAKIQAGLSSVLSGFLFGLIDPKTISQFIDKFKEKIIWIFKNPLETLKIMGQKIFSGTEWLGKILNTISFRLIPADLLPNIVMYMKNKIIDLFIKPFNEMRDWLNEHNPIDAAEKYIQEKLDSILNDFKMDFQNLAKSYNNLKNDIKDLFRNPVKLIKSFFEKPEIEPHSVTYQIEPRKKIISIPDEENRIPKIIHQIKTQKIQEKKEKETLIEKTINNQTLLNSNVNNNIVAEDMSISNDDIDYRNLKFAF